MRSRRTQKGYTLIEVVVALCVSAVLFASMIAVMAPVYRIYARTRQRSDAQLVAGAVLDSIRATCSNARSLEAADSGTLLINGGAAFTAADGYLMFDDDVSAEPSADLVLSRDAYNGKTIELSWENVPGQENTVRVTLTVLAGEGASCTLQSTVGSMRAVLNTPAP